MPKPRRDSRLRGNDEFGGGGWCIIIGGAKPQSTMTKNKKKKQPVIPQRRKNEELRAVLEKYFPGALQAKNGGYVVNSAMLQDAISPEHGKVVDEGFELRWVGKKEAYHHAYTPNDKILKPLRADSADFDGTRNILIKGDNLDALKLLRLNYFERVKVIYIDPPYNTASDEFVYNDNYTKSQEAVLNELGYGAEQKEFIKNINGDATHSGWLNFMYPRLLLAKDLLADDGVIFISIDDNEQANLKLICDEIFGENNFLNLLSVLTNLKGSNSDRFFAGIHEYGLVYAKNINANITFNAFKDENGHEDWSEDETGYWKRGGILSASQGKTSDTTPANFPVYVSSNDEVSTTRQHDDDVELYPTSEGKTTRWYWSAKIFKERKDDIIVVRSNGRISLYGKQRMGLGDVPQKKPKTILYKPSYGQGTTHLKRLIGSPKIFNNPKSVHYIKDVLSIFTDKSDVVLDFFAGSATTGHAVMQLNAEDNGKRQFILVQLPEKIDAKKTKEPYKFTAEELGKEPTIFEIAAERLRRAGAKVREEWENTNGNLISGEEPPDVGFRVFEIAEDIGNEMYERPLAEITHGDIAALPLDSPHDDDTILCNMMLGEAIVLDAPVQEHVKGALYQASDEGEDSYALFVLGEFSVKENYQLLKHARLVCVYDARIKNDKFILELKGNFADKVAVKGKIR